MNGEPTFSRRKRENMPNLKNLIVDKRTKIKDETHEDNEPAQKGIKDVRYAYIKLFLEFHYKSLDSTQSFESLPVWMALKEVTARQQQNRQVREQW